MHFVKIRYKFWWWLSLILMILKSGMSYGEYKNFDIKTFCQKSFYVDSFSFSFLGFKSCNKTKRNMLNKLNKGGRKLGAKNDSRDNDLTTHIIFFL